MPVSVHTCSGRGGIGGLEVVAEGVVVVGAGAVTAGDVVDEVGVVVWMGVPSKGRATWQ